MKGAAILAMAGVTIKIITAIFKIPLLNMLGDEGSGHFQITYVIYGLMITISTAGLPVALSRLISSASATGRTQLVKRYVSVALPVFALLGLALMLVMIFFADGLAAFMGDPDAALGIQAFAPAVFFGCIISVYRGYFQGHNEMLPTAVSQLMEALSKLVFGLLIAWILIQRGFGSPIALAGANIATTIGLGLAIPMLLIFKRRYEQRYIAPHADKDHQIVPGRRATLMQILSVSVPMTLGASILNIMTFVDTSVVLTRLQTYLPKEEAVGLLGVYTKGLSIFNLPSALIGPIAFAIVPAIAAAVAARRRRESKEIMSSSLKITNLVAMPAGIGLAVLAQPIFNVLYWNSSPIGPTLLTTFGIASYFMSMQLVTIGILQANGLEKIPLLTCTIGGLLQIGVDWYLVGQPLINITGSPYGTLTCYGSITLLNLLFVALKVKDKPDFRKAFVGPLLCAGVMGVGAWASYKLIERFGTPMFGSGHAAMAVYLFAAIIISVVVYGVLIIATKTITREDMKLIPRGDKIAKMLKIK